MARVTDMTDTGFEIEAVEAIEASEIDGEAISGQEFGEG
jgi:hypothetical protein